MTTPYERLKALRAARDLLRLIQADDLLSPALRHRAAKVLCDYPSDECLHLLIEENRIGLPDDVTIALSACSLLVHAEAGECRQQTTETSRCLGAVARHFPDVGELLHLRDLRLKAHLVATFANGIASWIAKGPALLGSGVRELELLDPR